MSEKMLQEDMLAQYMKQAEAVRMGQIPPESELHHQFSGRFLRKMRALLRYERRPVRMRKVVSGFRHMAAAFLLVLGVACVLTLSVDAYREKLFEIVMEVFPELTSIRTAPKDPSVEHEFEPIEPGYVPEGYEVEEKIIDAIGVSMTYMDQNEKRIGYYQTLLGTGETILDTEDAKTETIIINGQEIMIIEKNRFYILWWINEPCEYLLNGDADPDELKKMAESIIEKSME